MDTRKRKLESETDAPITTAVSVITPTVSTQSTSSPSIPPKPSASDEVVTPELLRMYYDRFFPCSLFMQWLSPADPDRLKLREFSFTLKDDVYIRYLSFANKDELKAALTSKIPYKIDIGAMYNAAVRQDRRKRLLADVQEVREQSEMS
jgi:hypothetical protein